jgi:hypothetical protein
LWRRAILGGHCKDSDLPGYEADMGVHFPWVGQFYNFDTARNPHGHDSTVNVWKAQGRGLHVAFQPEQSSLSGPTVQMADIAAGVWDPLLLVMLQYLRDYSLPVVVRFGHEFNGHWYKWSAAYEAWHPGQGGCKSPGEWVAAFRHVVDLERGMPGASNIRWYWCAAAFDSSLPGGAPKIPMEAYWPGADSAGRHYADIVGADGYNNNEGWNPSVPGSGNWRTFEQVFCDPDPVRFPKSPWYRINALDSRSPFWVGETGCVEAGAGQVKGGVAVSKAQWLTDMFNSTTALTGGRTASPRLFGLHYFNWPNPSFGDRRVTTSVAADDAARAGYQRAINPNLDLITGWGVRP